jgi:hypothetical protein
MGSGREEMEGEGGRGSKIEETYDEPVDHEE